MRDLREQLKYYADNPLKSEKAQAKHKRLLKRTFQEYIAA